MWRVNCRAHFCPMKMVGATILTTILTTIGKVQILVHSEQEDSLLATHLIVTQQKSRWRDQARESRACKKSSSIVHHRRGKLHLREASIAQGEKWAVKVRSVSSHYRLRLWALPWHHDSERQIHRKPVSNLQTQWVRSDCHHMLSSSSQMTKPRSKIHRFTHREDQLGRVSVWWRH